MQQTLRPSIFFPLPQCRDHLDNDHCPRRARTDFCAITLCPEALHALYIIGALNGSRIRITSPLFTQQPLESRVVGGLGLFQLLSLPLLYMEQRQSSDGGSNRKSTGCFGKKRRTSWGFRVKQRERGRMVTTTCRLHSC